MTNVTWEMTGAGAYQFQTTTNLLFPTWTNAGEALDCEATNWALFPPSTPGRAVFYRLVEVPQ